MPNFPHALILDKLPQKLRSFSIIIAMGLLLTACDLGSPTCKVEYELLDDWGSGFRASLILENEKDEALAEWELDFPTQPQQTILSVENAEIVADPTMARLRSQEGVSLPAGGTSQIFMTVSQKGARLMPDRFQLNGRVCEGGTIRRVSFLDQLGEIVELLVGQSPANAYTAPQDGFVFSSGSKTAELGFIEIHRGMARFFATGAPWADLQVEAPGTSRHVRMQKTQNGNEYMIFGLRPGALIRYRFLVGLNGQAWTNWHEAVYSGINGQEIGHRVPRVRELSEGR
ncbi:cellulose-binding domain-containing protein, partial [Myxococcota bacterium]|nr:cellulose-binding domain-containing protein [Myxococcota bacterium]